MSEYQYYEWQTIDRALTSAEQAAVNALSSHIGVTATGAWVDYHWSGFKHDPLQVLARYFDAFLYYANWGTKQLAFRFPRDVLDVAALQPFLWEYCAELKTVGEHLVLEIANPDEDGGDWFEGDAHVSTFTPLRRDILAGDYRALYLAWVLAAAHNDIDEELEPPVPAGLGELTAALEAFVAFFGIDPHFVQAAAEASEPLRAAPAPPWDALIGRLSRAECEAFLRRLVDEEPMLALKFTRRLAELVDRAADPHAGYAAVASAPRRTWVVLRDRAEQLRDAEVQRSNAAAEAARIRRLEALALREAEAWNEVHALIEQKQSRSYDEAVALLCELRDLALYRHEAPEFKAQVAFIQAKYTKRPGLLGRLQTAGLI